MAFARFASSGNCGFASVSANKSSKYWKIKTRGTRKKYKSREAYILGIKIYV